MAFSQLPPAYCTNVHPCRSLADVPQVLDRHALAVRERCGFAISVGLWLPEAAVAAPGAAATVAEALAARKEIGFTVEGGDYFEEVLDVLNMDEDKVQTLLDDFDARFADAETTMAE